MSCPGCGQTWLWVDSSSFGATVLGLGLEPSEGLEGEQRWLPLCPWGAQVSALVSVPIGLAAWEEYPTLKMLMEMVMTK